MLSIYFKLCRLFYESTATNMCSLQVVLPWIAHYVAGGERVDRAPAKGLVKVDYLNAVDYFVCQESERR